LCIAAVVFEKTSVLIHQFFKRLYLLLILTAVSAYQPSCTLSTLLPNANVSDPLFCPYIWATALNIPRAIAVASNGDLLVVEQGPGQVTALWDANNDGQSDPSERVVLVKQTGLNHGVAIDEISHFVYASSSTDVYRWTYTAGTRTALGAATHVVSNVPCCHHVTRTLAIDPDHTYLYVQSGSGANVDPDPTHAEIRRFKLTALSSTPVDWSTGQLVAEGLRNEVGLAFDKNKNLWGVENGVDDLYRDDLGGDIHNDNPCEELNLFSTSNDDIGYFYGYPYCWSEYILPNPPGKGTGTQWLQPDFSSSTTYSDAWCQDKLNVRPPAFCFPAHNAPLGILFGNITDASKYSMMAYATFHGSWDRTPPDGYLVREVHWDSSGVISSMDLLKYAGPGATGTNWPRPVGLGIVQNKYGPTLMISSDSNYNIIALAYNVTNASEDNNNSTDTSTGTSTGTSSGSEGRLTSSQFILLLLFTYFVLFPICV